MAWGATQFWHPARRNRTLRNPMPHTRARLEEIEIPESIPGFTIRRYRPGDEAGIQDAFHRVFAAGNPQFAPRSLERWRWQFERNPAGTQILIAVHDETGAVAGHYAGVPRAFRGQGREGLAAEAVDSFVDPRFRAALRRPGLFVVLALAWFREFTASGADFFAYGLPIETAARIGGAFLDYQVVHHQLALERAVDDPRVLGGPAAPGVSVVDDFDGRFERLSEEALPGLGSATVRSAAYLRWRYLEHPDHRYVVGAAGEGDRLRGYVVLRRGAFDGREDELVVDFVVPAGDLDAARALLRFAAQRAREEGAPAVSLVLPPSSAWFREIQRLGFYARPTRYDWSVSHNRRPYETHVLRRDWWYTLGDTDLA